MMVTATSLPYIEASVPVLREHGVTITRRFYSNMFAAHPELKNLFNMGNQASGAQQQSLAAAVFAYAANIGNAAALAPVVARIVHKHASVGIRPEHYPIVGHHLLGAIKEVLGDAASEPLLAAWAEAYGELAGMLIAVERDLYAMAGVQPGELRDMRITEVRQQSENVRSYTLAPVDGGPAPAFKPGQYISVSVLFPDGHVQLRQYSLSDAPAASHLRISVKREPAGHETPQGEVSNWLHDHAQPGDVLRTTHPFGEFTPDAESGRPVVLLSAGVGITPMVSVLKRIAETHPERSVIFGHAARDPQHHAHREDIAAAQARMPNLRTATFYEHGAGSDGAAQPGFMRIDALPPWPLKDTEVYLCGPLGFMRAQWKNLLTAGVPASRLHREVFGPEMLDYLE
jgi:nitric oxide dioxygenase